MSNDKGISSTVKPQFPDLQTLLATFSKRKFSDLSPCTILMIDPSRFRVMVQQQINTSLA